jgi:hypothetical protein
MASSMTMWVHLSYGFALIRFPSSAARRTGFVLAQLGADMARDASARPSVTSTS